MIPRQSAAQVKRSIVDPSAELTQGYSDIMPKNFGQVISPQELNDLVDFLLEYSGPQGGKEEVAIRRGRGQAAVSADPAAPAASASRSTTT